MFDLHITCSKDINFLKINFSDGTSAIGNSEQIEEVEASKSSVTDSMKYENFSENQKKFEKVKLPEIKEQKREVKVAEELQDLEL